MSHVRIAPQAEDIAAVRIAAGGADLILGCDIVVSTSPTALNRVRRLIADYLAMIEQRVAGLRPEQIAPLAKLARLPETIRGYGHIKKASVAKAMAEKARLEAELENSRFSAAAE